MSQAKHGKPTSQFPLSSPLGEIFAHNANLWFQTHTELLASVDQLTHAWLTRRREGVEAMREAIQQMTECQDAAEMLGIQQEWLRGDAQGRRRQAAQGEGGRLIAMAGRAVVAPQPMAAW